MQVKFKKNCTFMGNDYFENDTLEITKDNIENIWALNEKSIIYPISLKEFEKCFKEINKKINSKKEEE